VIASLINAVPLLPASAGAVPSTVTFPVTAWLHTGVVWPEARKDSAAGTVVAQVPLLGSPTMIALNPVKYDLGSDSHVLSLTTVGLYPAAAAASYSALEVPPFTLEPKISTVGGVAAFAGDAATVRPTAAAATPAATTPEGTRPDAASDRTDVTTAERRTRRARRAPPRGPWLNRPMCQRPAIATRPERELVKPAANRAIAHPLDEAIRTTAAAPIAGSRRDGAAKAAFAHIF
jgi:hypothetical protein